jgi:O-succinylbenzoate synthase
VRIEGVEVTVASLSLRVPVASAAMSHSDKSTLLLRVLTDQGSGWGECSAYPGARPPDPTVEAVEPAVVDRVVGRLFEACHRGRLVPAAAVAATCGGVGSVSDQSVAAALEMAVLDAELRSSATSLASRLGVTRREVESGALVGIPPERNLGALVESVGVALESGARRIRVKIEPGWDHVPLEAIRASFGDAVLQADANGSFQPGSAAGLRGLDAYGLRCLEQPFGLDDLRAHRDLALTMSTPIGLDESLWSLARVRDALAAGACRVACLKPGRLGGVFAAVSAAELCAQAGVDCFVGGFFETGLGRAVNAALSGRAEFALPGDLGDPDGYLDANPFSYLASRAGEVTLSEASGLGAELREDVLSTRRLSVRLLSYPG